MWLSSNNNNNKNSQNKSNIKRSTGNQNTDAKSHYKRTRKKFTKLNSKISNDVLSNSDDDSASERSHQFYAINPRVNTIINNEEADDDDDGIDEASSLVLHKNITDDLKNIDPDKTTIARSYDDFIQQSVEVGSFLNFNTNTSYFKKVNTSNSSNTNLKYSAQVNEDDDDIESSSTTTFTNSYNKNDKLVLIKYKKSPDDNTYDSLRANQLQKRREIHSLLLFIFFLFVTIITLSQILVMHSQTNNSNFYQIKLMQEELKLMDISIDKMLKEKHVLPMQVWYALKQYNDNLRVFSTYMNDFSSNYNFTIYSVLENSFLTSNNNSLQNVNSNQTNFPLLNREFLANNLKSELNTCIKRTAYDMSNILEKLTISNKDDHQYLSNLTLYRTDTLKNKLNSIYIYLIDKLNDLDIGNNKTTLINENVNSNSSRNSENSIPNLNKLLLDHTQFMQVLMPHLTIEKRRDQEKCLQTILHCFFYYFNNRYTKFFESETEFKKKLKDRNHLINKTLELLKNEKNQILIITVLVL